MGQLSQSDANSFRNELVSYLERCKKDVRENFTEMDFENADKRKQMETHISNMERKYSGLINELNGMSFE
ncbi:hypothetical protein [Pseudobutyrivibrio sp.]|jgi:hypothetical protein